MVITLTFYNHNYTDTNNTKSSSFAVPPQLESLQGEPLVYPYLSNAGFFKRGE